MKKLITSIIQQLFANELQSLSQENLRLQLIAQSFHNVADTNAKFNDLRIKYNNLLGDNSELITKVRNLESKLPDAQDGLNHEFLISQIRDKNTELKQLNEQLQAIKITGTAENPQKQINIIDAFDYAKQCLPHHYKEHFNNIIEYGKTQANIMLENKAKISDCNELKALFIQETNKPKERKPYTKKN